MLVDVVSVTYLGDYRLRVSFDDGTSGEVDLQKHLSFEGVFAPLKDQSFFSKVKANPDLGTLSWENGADIDPIVLFSWVTGKPIPDYSREQGQPILSKVA